MSTDIMYMSSMYNLFSYLLTIIHLKLDQFLNGHIEKIYDMFVYICGKGKIASNMI
jgi:hypothetical protein